MRGGEAAEAAPPPEMEGGSVAGTVGRAPQCHARARGRARATGAGAGTESGTRPRGARRRGALAEAPPERRREELLQQLERFRALPRRSRYARHRVAVCHKALALLDRRCVPDPLSPAPTPPRLRAPIPAKALMRALARNGADRGADRWAAVRWAGRGRLSAAQEGELQRLLEQLSM